jgi:hypothetical protein
VGTKACLAARSVAVALAKSTEENMKSILVASFILLVLFSGGVIAQDNIDKKKIDYLITSIEHSEGAKFIRNGTEHDGKEAAAHLRSKLKSAGGKVKNVEDFIRLCATRSYISGKPYRIVTPDGNIVNSEQYFREKLMEYSSVKK